MRLAAALLLTALAPAQSPPSGAGAMATRTIVIPADEALIDLTLTTTRDVTLDGALRILEPFGARSEHLTGLSISQGVARVAPQPTPTPQPVPLAVTNTYAFTISVEPSAVPKLVDSLQQALRTPPPGVLNLSAAGALNASDTTLEATRVALLPQLFADARRRATQWRQAAGIAAGDVASLADNIAANGRTIFVPGDPVFILNTGTRATYSLTLRSGEGPRAVTAFASKTVALAPEEATFTVQVETMPSVTADQVAAALAPAGFAGGDVQRVSSTGRDFGVVGPPGTPVPQIPSTVVYELSSIRPADQADSTVRALEQVQRSLPAGISSVRFAAAMRVRPDSIEQLRQNLIPLLLQDATRKAGDLARLAGWRLGSLVNLNAGPGGAIGFAGAVSGTAVIGPGSNLRVLTTVSASFAAE